MGGISRYLADMLVIIMLGVCLTVPHSARSLILWSVVIVGLSFAVHQLMPRRRD